MTETSYARTRRASLAGLVLQLVATVAAVALSMATFSSSLAMLAFYLAGGIPMWFIVLLVFRQHELAALEEMDLEELRREKQATGGGAAIFDEEGGGGLGFRVAQARLDWMRKWLVPIFGLITSAYLITLGIIDWAALTGREADAWLELRRVDIGLVITALVMLFLFFYARYAAGMARVTQWRLLRGCGSYMLGNSLVTLAIIVALGAYLYQGSGAWERYVAYAIPVLMVVLGVESLINFLLDLYRPRSPGVEPRACFDSRLIGLVSEPGGIAHSVAEAMNYQFGFEVSQTWFYQLLQRAFISLAVVGAVAVWLLSCLVIVQPYERAIIERFGEQTNAEAPLEPGLHVKWPAPIETAHRYNTDQLHEFYIGYRDSYQPDREKLEELRKRGEAWVELWTDPQHSGREHFDFVIPPTPSSEGDESAPVVTDADHASEHLVRMQILVQYKIDPDQLPAFTRHMRDPHKVLRNIAWNEVERFAGSMHIDDLMGEMRDTGGELLQERIAYRAEQMKLGFDIRYVGIVGVHPEEKVALAFRGVVTAQQEKIAKIREARVSENERLSRVAGDKRKAIALAHAIDQVHAAELRRSELERVFGVGDSAWLSGAENMESLWSAAFARLEAQRRLDVEWRKSERVHKDFELGLSGSPRDLASADEAVKAAEQRLSDADVAWRAVTAPVRLRLLEQFSEEQVDFRLALGEIVITVEFWTARLEQELTGLEGAAAAKLAEAQARRWEEEMRAAGEVSLLESERYAYAAAPEIYKTRSYLRVLVDGIKDARKYFLAFDPGDRRVHVRLETQEQAQADIVDIPTQIEE